MELPAELKGFTADSDVLPHPQLVEGAGGAATPADLHSLEQALLLAWCLHVRKGSAADGLQPWEMAAYVDAGGWAGWRRRGWAEERRVQLPAGLLGCSDRGDAAAVCVAPTVRPAPPHAARLLRAVARQERTQFLLHTAAALQASRLEKQRSRTRDRALLQLEQLAEVVDKAAAGLTPEMRLRCVRASMHAGGRGRGGGGGGGDCGGTRAGGPWCG